MNKSNPVPIPSLLACRELASGEQLTQRELSLRLGVSLGKANSMVRDALARSWVSTSKAGRRLALTDAGRAELDRYRVDSAIILAAGIGSRFLPLTYSVPKGLLKVRGQVMLERQIEQLREAGVSNIVIVVGYLKEAFDYLIDKYGVKLVYNPEYATKNNLASLYVAREHLKNSYILASDNYLEQNIFHREEFRSWYCCSLIEGDTSEWIAETTRRGRVRRIRIGGSGGLALIGPAFVTASFSRRFTELLEQYYGRDSSEYEYWEQILVDHIDELELWANDQTGVVHELESLEELRVFDPRCDEAANDGVLTFLAGHFGVSVDAIGGIGPLKEGITNRSFLFAVNGRRYVFRKPGARTDRLVDRANEKRVYELIAPYGLADELEFLDSEAGVKISRYHESSHEADPTNDDDLALCMELLARLHKHAIVAPRSFDIGGLIDAYQGLADEIGAIHYHDIDEVSGKVAQLLGFREALAVPEVLCHADATCSNILFLRDGTQRLIDWEYAGGGDPLREVAMDAINACFDRARAEYALEVYLGRTPDRQEKARLYLYMALGGFLWSMWTEHKQGLGVEFGEYGMLMYRYLKDYHAILTEEGYLPND